MPGLRRPRLGWSAASAAALGALAGGFLLPPIELAGSMTLAALMGAVAAEDLRRFRVPDALTAATALAGLLFVAADAHGGGPPLREAIVGAVLSAAICGAALLAVREAFFRWRGVDGLGLGDVKLACAGGVWLGWQAFPFAILGAAMAAIAVVAVVTLRSGGWPRERPIPFALYLAPAIWASWQAPRLLAA